VTTPTEEQNKAYDEYVATANDEASENTTESDEEFDRPAILKRLQYGLSAVTISLADFGPLMDNNQRLQVLLEVIEFMLNGLDQVVGDDLDKETLDEYVRGCKLSLAADLLRGHVR
jgi:hypothetical protein